MLRSPSGKNTSRLCPLPSSVVTTPMCSPLLISENNSRFPPSIHVSDEAFLSITRGSPPITGTSHTSQGPSVLYTTFVPSGENVGLSFHVPSCVNCTGSPEGSSFTKIWPGPINVSLPRMNVSIRPSGEISGYTAESAKNVNCCHLPASAASLCPPRQYSRPKITARANVPTPATHHIFLAHPGCSGGSVAVFPVSVSRFSRCR